MAEVKIICPYCSSRGKIRTSSALSDTLREYYFDCTNLDCGHAWKSEMTYVYGIRPSRASNPDVDLPMSQSQRGRPRSGPDPGDNINPDQAAA